MKNLKITATAVVLAGTLLLTGCGNSKLDTQESESDSQKSDTVYLYYVKDPSGKYTQCEPLFMAEPFAVLIGTGEDSNSDGEEDTIRINAPKDVISVNSNVPSEVEYLNEILKANGQQPIVR